jgi:acetylornithine deacetylase
MYGRGTYDMKGGVAAILDAAAQANSRSLRGDVIVTLVADEELGSIGTEAVVEHVCADAAIVVEPTEMEVAVAHKGFVWLELETTGAAAHGSRYDLGVDAIAKMGPVLVGVAELDERLRAERRTHPLLGGASLHASLIEGGHDLSTYPDRCVLKVERRTLPGETVRGVEEELSAVAGESATVKTLFAREPLTMPEDEPIVSMLVELATSTLGRRPQIVGAPFWTDGALLFAAGIPTVVFGPRGEGAHADTEWVDLDDLASLAQIVLTTAEAFCA